MIQITCCTADFCTGSLGAGGEGGEGEAMIEAVHGAVVVFEGELAEVSAAASPGVVVAHEAATHHA